MERFIVFVRDREGHLAYWYIILASSAKDAALEDANLRPGKWLYDVFPLGDIAGSFVL